jgi:hypothetical protein
MYQCAKFFVEVGIGGEDEESVSDVLRSLTLGMCSNFHGSPEYWLAMPLGELFEWTMKASQMLKPEPTTQNIGPGL